MPVAPPTVVASPVSPAGRRYSILDAANGPLDLPGGRLAGVNYEAPWCASATARDVDCTSPGTLDPGPGTGMVEGVEFTVESALSCLAPGKPWSIMESQIRDALEATEHVAVEDHVADALAVADDLVTLPAALDTVEAMAALEEYAYATARYGLRAVIHAPMGASPHISAGSQTFRTAPTWTTALGTVVYFNAGLPLNTMYITGQLTLWRSPSVWVSDERASLDRTTNEWKAFAMRDYVAAWECLTAAVTVEVT